MIKFVNLYKQLGTLLSIYILSLSHLITQYYALTICYLTILRVGRDNIFCIWTTVFYTNESVTIYFVRCSIHPKHLYICSAVSVLYKVLDLWPWVWARCELFVIKWIGVWSSCDSKYIVTAKWVDNYFAENVGRMNRQKKQWMQKTPKDCGSSVKDGLAYLGYDMNRSFYFW